MTITVDQVKSRIETDLDDTTLQLIVDAETEAVEREHGDTTEVETHLASGTKKLILKRRPSSIDSITERHHLEDDAVTLSSNDYRQIGNRILYRLGDGDNPEDHWGQEVVITYTVEVDANLRDRVILDLVQLAVEFRGVESEEEGDYSGDQSDYHDRREKLLRQIREPSLPLV